MQRQPRNRRCTRSVRHEIWLRPTTVTSRLWHATSSRVSVMRWPNSRRAERDKTHSEVLETHQTQSEAETTAVGRAFAERLEPGAVLLIDGPLGAGKTAFVRGL